MAPVLSRYAIPTFSFMTPKMDDVIRSIKSIKNPLGFYSLKDTDTASQWITICSLNYLMDQYTATYKKEVTPSAMNDCKLYLGQCSDLADVNHNLLLKANVYFNSCDMGRPDPIMPLHDSILAQFYPEGGYRNILYDGSLRQFFDTDQNGQLQDGHWKDRSVEFTAQELMMNNNSREVTTQILQNGWCEGTPENLGHYIRGFFNSMRKANTSYRPDYPSNDELARKFIQNKYYPPDSDYKDWAFWPGESGTSARAGEFMKRAEKMMIY